MSDQEKDVPVEAQVSYFVVNNKKTSPQDLEQHAIQQGQQNLPSPDAKGPNDAESAIINHFGGRYKSLAESTCAKLRTIESDFRKTARELPDNDTLANVIDNAHTEVNRVLMEEKTHLVNARKRERKGLRDLRAFREKHKIPHEAHYPASTILHWAVIGTILLVESLMNMYFFAQGNNLGYLGGFFQALLVAVLNVGSAALVGRYLLPHLTVPDHRPWAASLLALYLPVVVFFNLLVAHYRDTLTRTSGMALDEPIAALFADPFALSFHSIVLLLLGIAVAAIGMREGFKSDDPFPGYGHLDRIYHGTKLASDQAHQSCMAKVLAKSESIEPGCDALVAKGGDLISRLERSISEAEDIGDEFETKRLALEARCEYFLKVYRESNQRVRTLPPPPHFAVYPAYPALAQIPDGLQVGTLEAELTELKRKHQSMANLAKQIALEGKGRIQETQAKFETFVHTLAEQVEGELRAEGHPDWGR